MPRTSLLFVCLGNICRSPTAEAVMRHLVEAEGLGDEVEVDSAGTGDWHVGEPPDPRSVAEARRRGITMGGHARQVTRACFDRYDLLVAMDASNVAALRRLAPDDAAREKVVMLRSFAPDADPADLDVPDPYFGEGDGFARVFDIVRASCAGLLDAVRAGRV